MEKYNETNNLKFTLNKEDYIYQILLLYYKMFLDY